MCRSIMVAFAVALVAGRSFAISHHSGKHGYNLDVPEGWVQVSKEVLDTTMASVIDPNAGTKLIFDAAFQRESASPLFLEYPYLLVQIIPYAEYGVKGQIHESDFDEVIRSFTGRDAEETWNAAATPLAKQLAGAPDFQRPTLDRQNRRYIWDLSMDLQAIGKIKGRCVGYFGRDSIVQLAFYAAGADWKEHEAAGTAMMDSFKFDPDRAYSEELAAQQNSFWSRLTRKGAGPGGATVIGVIALIAYLARRRRA
jgi:hypothetical protein